jgi:hypothetical protein
MGERKHQITSQVVDLQQDFLGLEKRRWILSDNQQRPIQRSQQFSVEAVYNQNKWLLTMAQFYKKVNGITSMSQGFQNQFEFVITNGAYEVFGTEFLVQKQFNFLTAWMSYTFQENNYDFNQLNPSDFPNNLEIKHALKTALLCHIDRFQISIGGQWFTGKPNTLPQSNVPVFTAPETPIVSYQMPNAARLENYFQVNLSGAYAFNFKDNSKLKTGFSIQNVLNNQVNINQNHRINNANNLVEQINTFSLARTPNAFLRYEF